MQNRQACLDTAQPRVSGPADQCTHADFGLYAEQQLTGGRIGVEVLNP